MKTIYSTAIAWQLVNHMTFVTNLGVSYIDHKVPQVSSFFHDVTSFSLLPPFLRGEPGVCVCVRVIMMIQVMHGPHFVIFIPTGTAGAQWCTDLCNGHSKYGLLICICFGLTMTCNVSWL